MAGNPKTIKECNIYNYSIFHHNSTLFTYFEYTGDDILTDMAKMAADPETQRWWDNMEPMQFPQKDREESEW